MPTLTRRQMLQWLGTIIPVALVGYRRIDAADEERICIHVFDPTKDLPGPLLVREPTIPKRSPGDHTFEAGLSELILCSRSTSFLDLFPYFWPITPAEFQKMHDSISLHYQIKRVEGEDHVLDFVKQVRDARVSGVGQQGGLVVIVTYNDYTRLWSPTLIEACRREGVNELVIVKDPAREPYLCNYPTQQLGFRRRPWQMCRFAAQGGSDLSVLAGDKLGRRYPGAGVSSPQRGL